MEYVLFACTAGASIILSTMASATSSSSSGSSSSCGTLKNSAFVFVKPHANTDATQSMVREKLLASGIDILSESDINGKTIDEKKLIDQHYYAIASKATILDPKDIVVPEDKFQEAFGETWATALAEGRAANAMQACAKFGCTAEELDAAWQSAKVVKFGGGFYCGLVSVKDQTPLYVFNAFFMVMRSKFVGEEMSIHCYEVQWDPEKLSWASFRGELLGPTDPKDGPVGSIRRAILDDYKALGLTSIPNKGDNGVHASASPFEGLAEKCNWLGASVETDVFGKALLASGLSKKTITDWSVDPRVTLPDGSKGSVFDALEDMDVDKCLAKLVEMNKLNA
jgi:hypothetical protein